MPIFKSAAAAASMFMLVALASVPAAVVDAFQCPSAGGPWELFGSHCYKAVTEDGHYSAISAGQMCYKAGGNLASIHSQEDNNFVLGLIEKADPKGEVQLFWIGMHILWRIPNANGDSCSSARVSLCAWSDGSPVDYGNPETKKAVGNAPWRKYPDSPPEPNNACGQENCVAISRTIKAWMDHPCGQYQSIGGYICKRKACAECQGNIKA